MSARFSAPDRRFAEVVAESFSRQTLMATLGAVLVRVEPGEVDIEVRHAPGLTQQHGFLHAGVLAAVADSANGYAALTLAPAGSDVLAVEFKINLLRPAAASTFVARGRVLRPGRTLTACTADVLAVDGAQEELVATMLSTIIVRPA
ncbi:MAG: PaaI family thioesterase [Thermoanaerobaculia bacterium]